MYKKSTVLLFIVAFALLYSCKKDPPLKFVTSASPPTSGKYLLFDADESFNLGFSSFPSVYTSIYYSNLDGSAVTQITPSEPTYYSYRSSWSPDGKQVIFTRGNQADNDRSICTIDITGRNFKSIAKGDEADYGSFSPDGKKIVYAKSLIHVIPYNYDVYVANVDGSSEQRLTTFADQNGGVANIHWSADGKIYFSATSTAAKTGVYAINPDGTSLKYVMNDVFFDGISPDGKHLLFDLGSGLYICDSDGSNINTVFAFNNDHPNMLVGAGWSSDGNQIFFSNADYPTNFGVYRINIDGSGLTRLLLGYYEFPGVF